MINPTIWVHRRHASFPEVGTGFRQVKPEVAERMIADECAQPMDTDARKTKPITTGVYRPKTMKSDESGDPVETPAPKRRSYKRRDMAAEA